MQNSKKTKSDTLFSSIKSAFSNYFNSKIIGEKYRTQIKELLFSVSWPHVLVPLTQDIEIENKFDSKN